MDEFLKVSKELGSNILYMQGAGGNSSIKLKNKMYVKASGIKLKNIGPQKGYACCLYKPLTEFISNKKNYKSKDEEDFLTLIDSTLVHEDSFGTPSMETGFHAIIPSKYVFHLHSVYANIFGCMKFGSRILTNIFKSVPNEIIDYKNPGYELAFHLSKRKKLPLLLFLKNHGLIVHGDTTKQCLEIINNVHKEIEKYLKSHNVYIPFQISEEHKPMRKYSFPDSAVFTNINIYTLPKHKRSEILEIMSAQHYIVDSIKRHGGKPSYLSHSAVKKLLTMKQEKHRQKIFVT